MKEDGTINYLMQKANPNSGWNTRDIEWRSNGFIKFENVLTPIWLILLSVYAFCLVICIVEIMFSRRYRVPATKRKCPTNTNAHPINVLEPWPGRTLDKVWDHRGLHRIRDRHVTRETIKRSRDIHYTSSELVRFFIESVSRRNNDKEESEDGIELNPVSLMNQRPRPLYSNEFLMNAPGPSQERYLNRFVDRQRLADKHVMRRSHKHSTDSQKSTSELVKVFIESFSTREEKTEGNEDSTISMVTQRDERVHPHRFVVTADVHIDAE